jgi:hypothetical protein
LPAQRAESRLFGSLHARPGGWRNEVLPALGLHAVVAEQAADAEGNFVVARVAVALEEVRPVEPAKGQQGERASDGRAAQQE